VVAPEKFFHDPARCLWVPRYFDAVPETAEPLVVLKSAEN
jgi:hypothetical protein